MKEPSKARVSVAMATYKGAAFIGEQLRSLAEQTHLPYELVITDDQSTDDTQRIVEEFAREAPFPLRFFSNPERLYYASNFIRAAGLCGGDYVAFCDQDDIWLPNKIERSLAALAQPGVVLAVHDAIKIDSDGNEVGIETRGVPRGIVHGLGPMMGFSGFVCTFPRALLDLVPADRRPIDVIETDRKLSHDRWICFLAATVGAVANLEDRLALYRQHGDNAAGWMREKRSKREILVSFREKFGFYLGKRLQIISQFRAIADGISIPPEHQALFSQAALDAARARLAKYEAGFRARYAIAAANNRLVRISALVKAWRLRAYIDPITGRFAKKDLVADLAGAVLARSDQVGRSRRMLNSGKSDIAAAALAGQELQ